VDGGVLSIGTFKRNPFASSEENSFTLTTNQNGCGFLVDASGNLTYYFVVKIFDIDARYTFTQFAIGINSNAPGTIRPGDDMILRFALADNTDIITSKADGNFMAVYEHKLLWRAQLYIDETLAAAGNPSGNVDWNNAHPWTYAQGNEWDKDWEDSNNNGIIIVPNPAPTANRDWANWNDTLAPGNAWGNYIHGDPTVNTTAYNIVASNGTVYYPYAPGFSSYRKIIPNSLWFVMVPLEKVEISPS